MPECLQQTRPFRSWNWKVILINNASGNFLGPNSAREFGKSLKKNTTLRVLDLENNYLTNSSQDESGVVDFTYCLEKNKHLLSLNMANNLMGELCGLKFEQATSINKTLISFEFGFNNFKRAQVLAIQENLNNNLRDYKEERFREWKERKRMGEEDDKMRVLVIEEDQKRIREEQNEKRMKAMEKAREELWSQFLYEAEIDKMQLIQRLEESAKIRAEKGKGRRRKKGGGKKKK